MHCTDKQVAEYIMRMNEEEGTLSARPSPPLGVFLSGQSEAAAPYLEVDVSPCFFWQQSRAAQLAERRVVQRHGEWSVF